MSFFVTAAEYSLTAAKVAKLNKRAAKNGIAATATLVEIARTVTTEKTDLGFDRIYTKVEAEITGVSDVRFNGWTLASVIDHDVAGNITRTVPGFPIEIPAEFRTSSASRCDHCNAVRNRNQTILVWSEAEGFKQVGSDCVKLFLGVSVSNLIAWIAELEEAGEESDGYWGGGREYTTTEFLAAAALVTEVYGFKPSAFDGQSTKSIAWNLIALTGESQRKFLKDNPELSHPEAKMIERANTLAAESLVWIAAHTGSDDYILNLKTAARREAVGKNGGLLASLPNSFKRNGEYVAKKAAEAAEKAPSVHVGVVGGKITATVTVAYTNRSAGYSYHGPDALFVILLGADGNTYYLNTSVGSKVADLFEDSPKGTSFDITGTVKSHKVTDKGEAVTVITRLKVA